MARSKTSEAAARLGRKGGKARALKYGPKQLQEWARLGAEETNRLRKSRKTLPDKGRKHDN